MRGPTAIAAPLRGAYLHRVPLASLLRYLTILALVLSPLAMLVGTPAVAGSHAMMTAPEATVTPTEHCHDADEPSQDRFAPSIDCAVACAAVMPQLGDQLDGYSRLRAAPQPAALVAVVHGLVPEAADPPPRMS